MEEFERVVLAADGSEQADHVADHAFNLAKALKRPLHAVYVVDDAPFDKFRTEALALDVPGILHREAQKALGALVDRANRARVKIDTEVRTGDPAEEIVAAARPGDVLVIGTHGRRGLSRLLLGSIAESVVRHAGCSVMVVRPRKAVP